MECAIRESIFTFLIRSCETSVRSPEEFKVGSISVGRNTKKARGQHPSCWVSVGRTTDLPITEMYMDVHIFVVCVKMYLQTETVWRLFKDSVKKSYINMYENVYIYVIYKIIRIKIKCRSCFNFIWSYVCEGGRGRRWRQRETILNIKNPIKLLLVIQKNHLWYRKRII